MAAAARFCTLCASWADNVLGTKFPLSRKGSASGKQPVTAMWRNSPLATAVSTDT